ncbi:MAG: monothiol glutaredoxin, Grx4 family [Legionellales bacterium]|nr:monothiol glutaredoxin, Grx4 family [Legionellales bacterium]OUX67683.1 MAG: monothiol glutaredoxin, Grx4 family [bacterium TMED178]|tara:strand:+ start:2369 stop:2683 length:315 start_codon:yes stop_codon:yes gene_type:complete
MTEINKKIEEQLASDRIILYMKGEPNMPMCGFSAKVVDILQQYDVTFKSYNILVDDQLRQGLKIFSQWPTFPQLYIDGELIGGCDIIVELHDREELESILGQSS